MRKKRTIVDIQETSEIRGTAGAYQRFVGKEREDKLANPDSLPEQDASPSTPQLIMGEAVLHLQGRQKQVYLSVMRDDKSIAETGEILGISKGTVQTYLDRAIAFITAYCRQAMERERI